LPRVGNERDGSTQKKMKWKELRRSQDEEQEL
jgi:hypothetical protein